MKVIIVANEEQEKEIVLKKINAGVEINFINYKEINSIGSYDALLYLFEDDRYLNIKNFKNKPVFINAVTETLWQKKLPGNYSRINAWPGFLQRGIWEAASNNVKASKEILDSIGWKTIFVKDEPGFVAARVISMIVNEAYFALEEKVSTPEEINVAMKLGTNYPLGPFEWAHTIGLQNIYRLLKQLSATDTRYVPSSLLAEKCCMLNPT